MKETIHECDDVYFAETYYLYNA